MQSQIEGSLSLQESAFDFGSFYVAESAFFVPFSQDELSSKMQQVKQYKKQADHLSTELTTFSDAHGIQKSQVSRKSTMTYVSVGWGNPYNYQS